MMWPSTRKGSIGFWRESSANSRTPGSGDTAAGRIKPENSRIFISLPSTTCALSLRNTQGNVGTTGWRIRGAETERGRPAQCRTVVAQPRSCRVKGRRRRRLRSAARQPAPYTNFYRAKKCPGGGGPFWSAATGRRLLSLGQPPNRAACRPAARSAEHHRLQQGCCGESRRQAAGMRQYRAPQSGDQSPHSRTSRPRLDDGKVSRRLDVLHPLASHLVLIACAICRLKVRIRSRPRHRFVHSSAAAMGRLVVRDVHGSHGVTFRFRPTASR